MAKTKKKPSKTTKKKTATSAKKRATASRITKKKSPAKKKAPVKKKTTAKKTTPDTKKKIAKSAAPPKASAKARPKPKAAQKPKVASKPKSAPAPAKEVARTEKPRAASTARRRRVSSKSKPLAREFLMDLVAAIRMATDQHIREGRGRDVVGTAVSGDATFEVDIVAERALLSFLKSRKAPVAYYSEDAGYATFSSGQPEHLLIVDPIDGTRAAKSGFERCAVCVASTRVIERPTFADLDNACVGELLSDRAFYAEHGGGARIYSEGKMKRPKLSTNTALEEMCWSMTVPARPAELIFPTAARLIDLSSLKGGFFACNATSYSLTRLLTGQQDAAVDFANRYYRDIPQAVEDMFINAGRGAILGICPYDLAAGLLVAREGGCIVTDAYGNSFDDCLLLDSSVHNQLSMIAASNKKLHEMLLEFFDTRIRQYEQIFRRRIEAG